MAAKDMSQLLGEVYATGTKIAHTNEDAEKVAQANFFVGLCKQAGVNI